MGVFDVEVDGKTYEVEAPDAEQAAAAGEKLRSQTTNSPLGMQSNAGRAFSGGVANMAMFGFADEAAAGLAALRAQLPGGSGQSYSEILPKVRQQQGIDVAEHPYANVAGNVVGVVPSVMALGPLAAEGIATPITQAGSTGARVLGGAATGGGTSALYGFGSGEGGFTNRAENAGLQGSIGAVIGGAIPLVAQGASSAYRGVRDWMARNAAAREAGANPQAVQRIQEILAADQSLGPRGAANMARAGDEAMLADAGPNAQQALDAAVQFGGRGTTGTRQVIEERANRAAQQLQGALDTHLGAPEGVQTIRAGIKEAAQPALNDVYPRAYAQPIDYASQQGQKLESLVKNRVPKSAIDAANELMRVNGETSKQILAHVDDAGNVTGFETLPDVRQLDYITRGLNQVSKLEAGKGGFGGQTPIGAGYQNLSREIRSTLREAVPEYGHALDTAADPLSRSQAVEFGSKLLGKGVTRDAVVQELKGSTAAERAAMAQGVRSQIDDQMANVERALTDPNMDAREAVAGLKLLSSRSAREKVAHIIGDDAAAQLFGDVDRAATAFDLRAAIANNTKTFTRQSLDEGINASIAPNALQLAASVKPMQAVQRVAETVTGQNPAQVNAAKQEVYAQIADLLTRPAAQATQAFNAMTDSAAQQALNQVRADQIRRIVSSGAPVSYPANAQLTGRRQ